MSMISFTNDTCKNNDAKTKTLVDNFEEHFAMYTLTHIKKIPSIEISKTDKLQYVIKCNKKESKEIMNILSSYRCSHFADTLVPVFNELDDGLTIEFKIDGE